MNTSASSGRSNPNDSYSIRPISLWDCTGVTIAQTGGTTAFTEGGSETYTIVLNSQPTANVRVAVAPGVQCNVGSGMGTPSNVVFTTGNWNSAQTVTVSVPDDTTMQGSRDCTINHTVTSTDTFYNGIAPSGMPVVAHITDNDPGVIITQTGGSTDVVEGGATDTYTLVLNTPPTADVTVTVRPDTECSVGAGAGTAFPVPFTNATWNTPQTVTVTAIDDTSYKLRNS